MSDNSYNTQIRFGYTGKTGSPNITRFGSNIVVFGFPCGDSHENCAPYYLELSKGGYLLEAWGAGNSGLGGYASGMIDIESSLELYLFVGSKGMFNSVNVSTLPTWFDWPGSATDARLKVNENHDWDDITSLRSRILVAGGGASAEWWGSSGGHGGGLTGTNGTVGCYNNGTVCPEYYSTGGSQTKGGTTSETIKFGDSIYVRGLEGSFGVSNVTPGIDMGGIGGSGYWSGASMQYSGSGGGGSSFISGHPGCIALASESSNDPSPDSSLIHFSGVYFTNTRTIAGNNEMPLYFYPNARGIGNKGRGAFRVTLLSEIFVSCKVYNFQIFPWSALLIAPIIILNEATN